MSMRDIIWIIWAAELCRLEDVKVNGSSSFFLEQKQHFDIQTYRWFLLPRMDSALGCLGLTPFASGLVHSGAPKLDSFEQTTIVRWCTDKDLQLEIDVRCHRWGVGFPMRSEASAPVSARIEQ